MTTAPIPFYNYGNSVSDGDNGSEKPIYLQKAAVGYIALLNSMLANADSVQYLEAHGLMPLSEIINQLTQTYSDAWINVLNNPGDAALLAAMNANSSNKTLVAADYAQLSDLGKLTWDSVHNNGAIQADVTKFNMDNTLYNQATSFFGGITSGLNDSVSNTNNQVSLDYQQIQGNTLAVQSTLVTVL